MSKLTNKEKKEPMNVTIGRLRERLKTQGNERTIELFEKFVKEANDLELKV